MPSPAAVTADGRRMIRCSRRVGDDEVLMPIVVADATHEKLCTLAVRRSVTVEQLVATALERLADLA